MKEGINVGKVDADMRIKAEEESNKIELMVMAGSGYGIGNG